MSDKMVNPKNILELWIFNKNDQFCIAVISEPLIKFILFAGAHEESDLKNNKQMDFIICSNQNDFRFFRNEILMPNYIFIFSAYSLHKQ